MYPPSHLPLRGLTVYIDPLLLLVRVSKGLAHLEKELCSSIRIYSTRETAASTEKIHLGFKTPHGKIPLWIQDLLTEKNRLPLVSSVVDFGSFISLCVHGSSACVIILVGLSVLLCPPCDFPLVSLLVFFVFIAGSAPFVKDRPIRVLPYIRVSLVQSLEMWRSSLQL